jgi:hypothetical protein
MSNKNETYFINISIPDDEIIVDAEFSVIRDNENNVLDLIFDGKHVGKDSANIIMDILFSSV